MPLTGEETLHGPGAVDGTALDFWRWAYSDIKSNTLRGIFAEWLVARLLNLPLPQRVEWESYDLVTPSGVRIEVKSAAHRQVWHEPGDPPGKLSFGRLKSREWARGTGPSPTATFNADIYVLCSQIETDHGRWDAFDLAQWRFYVLNRAAALQINQRTISLPTLLTHTAELDASAFKQHMASLIASTEPFCKAKAAPATDG